MKLFKTLPSNAKTAVVGNPHIGEIEIPKYGSLTIGEHTAYFEKVNDLIKNDVDGLLNINLTLWKTTILIQSRIDPEWTHDKTVSPVWVVTDANDNTVSFKPVFSLLEAIEKFFDSERNQWSLGEFNLLVQGTGALSLAIAECDKVPGSRVVTNPSLQGKETYYVLDESLFSNDSDLIVVHYNEKKIEKKPGKS